MILAAIFQSFHEIEKLLTSEPVVQVTQKSSWNKQSCWRVF